MSGRSAYVRRKITQTDKDKAKARAHAGPGGGDRDDAHIPDFPLPHIGGSMPVGTGIGTTNARFLKFSEPSRDFKPSTPSIASGSGSSADGRREAGSGPLDEFAYARVRRPTIKTEDVSGIERSGLRSKLDKKSEDVRRGLAKTFTFKRKDKEPEFRPGSVATVRPQHHHQAPLSPIESEFTHEQFNVDHMHHAQMQMQMQMQTQTQTHQPEMDFPMSPPPAAKLPPLPTTPPIKRWIGAGRPVQRWNKLRKDPELWDPNGDVLIFFGHSGQTPRPNPSFRLSSHIIEATESRHLITLLREGTTEEDIYMLPSPQGPPSTPRLQTGRGQLTPPTSEDFGEADGQISYEMYFPTPASMNKLEQLRNQITTRNVFALLYHASLVGFSFHQALADLHTRLDAYMPPDSDNVGMIVNYICARGIDDVRNDAETAVSLLAWSEGQKVRWEEGWRESFLHCAGMYSQLEHCADYNQLTPITRALLERACLETQLRVQAAEERLAEFQYGDMWPPSVHGPAKAAAERLQKFLLGHYSRVHGFWPPTHGMGPSDGEWDDIWLTRSVAQLLQRDFGALYDYLVNRDITWDMSEARSGRKWMMISDKDRGFDADIDIPMTDMLVEYDNKLRFPHIPHPYPLVPESIPPPPSTKESSMFKKRSGGTPNPGGGRGGALERRVQLAYTEATNIYILGSNFTQSDLIDSFVKFEKTDLISEVDPAVARRGRWILIYGILQTLASVAVDTPNVRYRDDVSYHLCPRLKGTKLPPWKGSGPLDEAMHELSHCWMVQHTWNNENSSGAESPGGSLNTSPIAELGRALGHPRGLPSGYLTPGTRSIHSAGSAPVFSSGYSVVSESDTSSSVRTAASSRPGTKMRRAHSRDNGHNLGGGPGSFRGGAAFGGAAFGGADHGGEGWELPIRRRDLNAPDDGGSLGYSRSKSSGHGGQGLLLPNNVTGSGGFLGLDDMADSKSGWSGHGRRTGEGGETQSSAAPRIRDFDLDIIDDADP